MSSRRSALSALKPKTLPMIERDEVGDRPLLEEVEVVGDVRRCTVPGCPGTGVDPVGLRLIVLVGRQPVRPDDGPRGGRGLAGDRRGGLDGVDAVLRRDPERGEHVGVLGFVVRVPVAHPRVRGDARRSSGLRSLRQSSSARRANPRNLRDYHVPFVYELRHYGRDRLPRAHVEVTREAGRDQRASARGIGENGTGIAVRDGQGDAGGVGAEAEPRGRSGRRRTRRRGRGARPSPSTGSACRRRVARRPRRG